MHIKLAERYGVRRTKQGPQRSYRGEIEFIFLDAQGNVVSRLFSPNIVKIFAKEILAHRLAPTRIWDPNAGSGAGGWVASGIDVEEDFIPRYILFGASFDDNGAPLDTTDPRYYTIDPATGQTVPITLGAGAEYDGGLINAIPIADPYRSLKKVERVYFEPTYQPAGTPLLQADVRAMNNIIVLETTLYKDEYNGFGLTSSDYFTITEVALAAGKELTTVGACECDPKDLFLEGKANGVAITANATGTATVTIDPVDIAYVDVIKEGDQVKLVQAGETAGNPAVLSQINAYYLVITKAVGGSDIVLDRTPVDANNVPITGTIGVFKNTLRIFSHRILSAPFRKSDYFQVITRWRIILD